MNDQYRLIISIRDSANNSVLDSIRTSFDDSVYISMTGGGEPEPVFEIIYDEMKKDEMYCQ